MSTIVKNTKGRKRRHAAGPNGKPLCGGGRGAKKADYQIDIGDDVDCKPCLTILAKERAKNDRAVQLALHPWMGARRGSWRADEHEGIMFLQYSHRFEKGRIKTALTLSDKLLALIIAQGLNAVYPPPEKSRKTAPAKTDYEI